MTQFYTLSVIAVYNSIPRKKKTLNVSQFAIFLCKRFSSSTVNGIQSIACESDVCTKVLRFTV